MSRNVMQCGCIADSLDAVDGPFCSLHDPSPEARRIIPQNDERQALCIMCKRFFSSKAAVLDFEYRPDLNHDFFNCGCKG